MLVQKNIGETTSELSSRIKKEYSCNKVAVCGKLDPMARGVVRVLINENTKLMEQYLNSIKTYRFKLVLGIKTDTDDIMGLVSHTNNLSHNTTMINKYIIEICSRKIQHFHPFSAIKVKINGDRRSLHHWTLAGKINRSNLPSKDISVENIVIDKPYFILISDYYSIICHRLSSISTNNIDIFRVKPIISSWTNTYHDLMTKSVDQVQVIPIELRVSSGFYVRMLSYYLFEDYGIESHIFDIHRIFT